MTNMKTYKFLIIALLSLFLGAAACTPKESTRKRSYVDGDFEVQQEISSLSEKEQSEAEKLMALIQETLPILQQQEQLTEAEVDASMVFQKVIIPLRPYALNLDYLSDPSLNILRTESGYYPLGRIIEIFNRAIILINSTKKSLITDSDILPKYKEILLWDCDDGETLSGSCYFIKFYRGLDSTNMTRIMKMIHDIQSDGLEKEKVVRAAFEIKNRRLDASLRFMLLERLSESMKAEKAKTITRRRLKQDADLFANILRIDVVGQDYDEKYASLIRALDPWSLSRTVDDAKNQAMTEIIALAGTYLLYSNKTSKSLSPEINEAISKLHYKIGPQYEQGVKFQRDNIKGVWEKAFDESNTEPLSQLEEDVRQKIQNNLEIELFGGESAKILDNLLEGKTIKSDDEYYFLAHQIYFNHYNIDDANAFWNVTGKNQYRFMDAAINLIKMQIVNNIVFTNTRMNNFYDRNKNTKLIQLLRESDQEGSKIRKSWVKIITRAKLLKNFISRVYVSLRQQDVDQFREIESSVDALQKNIKFLVTYPNMFPLMYVLSQNQAKETVQGFFGPFEISDANVIRMFFGGAFPPWFNFGNDGNRLDTTEIIYTYHYALKTQIFKTYEESEVVKYSTEEFFERVINKMLYPAETTLQENLDRIQTIKSDYSSKTATLLEACEEEKRIQNEIENDRFSQIQDDVDAGTKRWEDALIEAMEERKFGKSTIAFEELDFSIYNLSDTRENRKAHFMDQLFDKTNSDLLRIIRTETHENTPLKSPIYTLALPRILIDLYKIEYPEQAELLDQIKKEQFDLYIKLRAQVIKELSESSKQLVDCPALFHKRDRDIRQALVFKEVQYYEDLYDALEAAHKGKSDPVSYADRLEELRKEYNEPTQNSKFPQTYRDRFGYTVFRSSSVTVYKMDILARLIKHLDEVFPGHYTITMPSDFTKTTEYKEDSPSEIGVRFSNNQNLAKIYKKQFVDAGIQAFEGNLTWGHGMAKLDTLAKQMEFLAEFYKLGKVATNPKERRCYGYDIYSNHFEENCYAMNVNTVIDYFDNMIDLMNITPRDEVIMSYTGNFEKYSELEYEKYIKREDTHQLYDRYDLAFKKVFSDETITNSEKAWFLPLLKKYVESVQKRRVSTFIFDYDPKVEEILSEYYGKWLEKHYQPTKGFLEAIQLRMKEGIPEIDYKYHINRGYKLGVKGSGELSPLVSDLILGKYREMADDIRQQTSSYFLPIQLKEDKFVEDLISGKPLPAKGQ